MLARLIRTLPAFFWHFFQFAFVCAFVGPIGFLLGQLLPRKNFDYKAFPYAPFKWEKNGMIYTRLKIQFWKEKVPDMSLYIKSMFRKKLGVFRSEDYLEELILETCVAEFVHFLLILASPIFTMMMEGVAGYIGMGLYIVGNLPFILIQRYNRPRLVMLMDRQQKRKESCKHREDPEVLADV